MNLPERIAVVAKLQEKAAEGPWAHGAVLDPEDESEAWVYGGDGDAMAHLTWNPGNDYSMPDTAAFIAAVGCVDWSEVARALEIARLVGQWHDSIGSGPAEELDAELGELARVLTRDPGAIR